MALFIGFALLLTGILLLAFGIRKGKAGLDKESPQERASAERFSGILSRCGGILAGLGFLLLILRFILNNLGVSLE
jgi:uncharacterized membrane protein